MLTVFLEGKNIGILSKEIITTGPVPFKKDQQISLLSKGAFATIINEGRWDTTMTRVLFNCETPISLTLKDYGYGSADEVLSALKYTRIWK